MSVNTFRPIRPTARLLKRGSCLVGLLAILLAGTFNPLMAQEVNLDPITITASLSEMRASETGRNITIIDGEKFRDLPVHAVDELLRYVPGVEVQSRGPMGSQSDIVLRGGTFQQVLVLVDGIRVNDPNTGHFSSYIPVAPAEIERIEILKGASSALYGADAVGGVIHVITKTFVASDTNCTTQVGGMLTAGAYGLVNGSGGFFINKERFAFSGGLVSNHAHGEPLRGINGYFHNTTASASATFRAGDHWQFYYRLGVDNRRFAAQNFYTTFLSDTATEQVSGIWNQFRVAWQGKSQRLELDAGIKRVDDHYLFSPAAAANQNHSMLKQLHLQYEISFAKGLSMVAGGNLQQKQIRSNDRGDHNLLWASPFVAFSVKPGKGLHLRPALQWVAFEHAPAEWVPQLDLSWRTGKLQWRGGIGKSIRDADFTERYNNYNKPLVTSGTIGNPDLTAERAWSYEAGVDVFLKNALRVSTTWFDRSQKRLIDFSPTAYQDMPRKDNLVPGNTYALARNVAHVRTRGMELDAHFEKKMTQQQQIRVAMGMTWLNSKSSDDIPTFYISSHARFLLNGFVDYRFAKLSLSLTGIYKERKKSENNGLNARLSPRYFVMNVRLQYFFSKRLSLYLEVDNAFDTGYSDLLGARMPGRWWMTGVKFQFRKP